MSLESVKQIRIFDIPEKQAEYEALEKALNEYAQNGYEIFEANKKYILMRKE